MESNVQKMRDALRMALRYLQWLYAQGCTDRVRLSDEIDRVVSALAAPPRNCDAEYADRAEMYDAFKDWCKAKGHTMEPMLAYDAFDWLFATAEEGGAK